MLVSFSSSIWTVGSRVSVQEMDGGDGLREEGVGGNFRKVRGGWTEVQKEEIDGLEREDVEGRARAEERAIRE